MKNNRSKKGRSIPAGIARIRPVILRITGGYGASNVRIFGSFARGEQRSKSDIDILVDLPVGMTLFELSGLKCSLEEALNRKVDVIPARSIKPALRDRIFSEALAL